MELFDVISTVLDLSNKGSTQTHTNWFIINTYFNN